MRKNTQKAKRAKKMLSLAAAAMILSGQATPIVAMAAQSPQNGSRLLSQASPEDIHNIQSCLLQSNVESFVPQNLMMKNFTLTNYEMLVISEIIKRDIEKAEDSDEKKAALKNLVDLQNKYSDEYEMIFNRLPKEIQQEAKTIEKGTTQNPVFGAFVQKTDTPTPTPASAPAATSTPQNTNASASTATASSPTNNATAPVTTGGLETKSSEDANKTPSGDMGGEIPSVSSQIKPASYSDEDIVNMAKQYGIPLASKERLEAARNGYQYDLQNAGSGAKLSDALSLINIRHSPMVGAEGDYQYSNPLNPVLEINKESDYIGNPDSDSKIEKEDEKYTFRSIQDIIDAAADIEDRKAKHFFLTLAHSIYYVDSGTEGAMRYDTSVRDDNGNLYQVATPEEHELQQTLEIGLGVRVHKAIDLILSMVAKNEDGLLTNEGTTWEFGNVMFKFHPERIKGLEKIKDIEQLSNLDPEQIKQYGVGQAAEFALKRLNSAGIIIRNGGRVVGKRIGAVEILTDTQSGNTSIGAGATRLIYDRDEGMMFSAEDSRYYLGFGKMSIDLSTYTLQLSDCKAVKVGYHDNAQELMLAYARPDDEENNIISSPYRKDVFAAQYIAKHLIPNMKLTFNFAKSMDKGDDPSATGVYKRNDTVYSMMVQGSTQKTSYEGEFAHIKNSYTDVDGEEDSYSANADYLDISHQFSDKLKAQLHLINIDAGYDASTMVQDKTGTNLLTTTKGDGTPDYLYETGQKGLDLTLNYEIDPSASMAFGYSRYKETTEGNSKTEFYLSGDKQWDLKGKGTISLQQHFGYNKVSNREEPNKSSDTTVSYSGEPWKGGSVSADWQRTIDQESGNQTRYDLTVAHDFKPVERVTITPKFQYERKKGDAGISETSAPMDTTTIINSLTVGYELVPEELTVNILVSDEKYKVIASEIDESTGKKIDGERRNTLGVGLGLAWEPKKIKGLSLGVSYRRDKVRYLELGDDSNQDVWEYSIEYSRPISDKIRATISYDYKSTKDKVKPIYDDVTRNINIDIDARIGKHSSIQLQHSYESEYKPMDDNATSTTHTTTLQMVNRF